MIEMDRNKTLNELRNVWKLNEYKSQNNIFESEEDEGVLQPGLHLSYFFQTHLAPQPWWGEITNPKVIVLGLNPSYDPINDEEDEKVIRNELLENLCSKPFNWFKHSNRDEKNITSGYKFWTDTLGRFGVKKDGLWCEPSMIFKNVGFFNLYGYHKSPFKEIQRKCFIDEFRYLPTQIKLANHLKAIINKETYVIVIWGYNYWKALGVLSKDNININRLLVVNRNLGMNNVITNAHKHDKESKIEDFSSKFDRKKHDIIKEYDNLYKEIQTTILS